MPANIEPYALPGKLYRFRTLGETIRQNNISLSRTVDSVKRGSFWCGRYYDLNDAMEGLYAARNNLSEQTHWRQARKLIRNHKAEIGIACFTEIWDQALMWAHYANSFRGVCIEYDFQQLREALPDSCSFCRISYADHLLEVGIDVNEPDRLARWILSTKHHSWAYEREWRLFSPQVGEVIASGASVSRLILGPRIPSSIAEELRRALPEVLIQDTAIDGYEIRLRTGQLDVNQAAG